MKDLIRQYRYPLMVWGAWLTLGVTMLYFLSAYSGQSIQLHHLLTKWDGGWYNTIISGGYQLIPGQQSNVAFFPLYPLLAYCLTLLGLSSTTAGSLLSIVCFGLGLAATYRLAQLVTSETTARLTVVLIAFFPFSYYFGLIYTESLFFLLTALTLLFTKQQRWWLAAVFAGLASGTRVIGVLLVMVLLAEYLRRNNYKLTKETILKVLGLGTVGVSGLMAFMLYLQIKFSSATAFINVQQYWPDRDQGPLGLARTAKRLLSFSVFSNPYALNITEILCLILFGAMTIYTFLRINRWWGAFTGLALLIPLVSGTTASLNRYVLVLIPCFIALAVVLKTFDRAVFALIPFSMVWMLYVYLVYSTMIFIG